MDRPLDLVWVNGPKKTRAKCRKEENWEAAKSAVLQILSDYSWEAAVPEVEKLGFTHVTYDFE
jgi:hypothetical protein